MKFLKAFLSLCVIVITVTAVTIYFNRQTIFDYSLNKLILNLLPESITIDELELDLDNKELLVSGFKISNPPGCKNRYLLEVSTIRCSFKQKNPKKITDGIIVAEPTLYTPTLYIERMEDSSINTQKMKSILSKKKAETPSAFKQGLFGAISYIFSPVKDIEQLVTLDSLFKIKNGKFVFDDSSLGGAPYRTTITDVDAQITLRFGGRLTDLRYIDSAGSGTVNGRQGERVEWVSGFEPTKKDLTMSNTFNIRDVDFTHFKPYYEPHSPFIFKRGKINGKFIFNFDNGDIGSVNEGWFTDLDIEKAKDSSMIKSWILDMVTVDDLYKYFSSKAGNVEFDFKIKGPMSDPKFYLGSKTKRALLKLSANKLIGSIFGSEEDGAESSPGEEKSDLERIVDIFKSFEDKE